MADISLTRKSARELASLIRTRKLSPVEVLDAHLAMGDRHVDDRPRAEALARHEALAAEWATPLRERLRSI